MKVTQLPKRGGGRPPKRITNGDDPYFPYLIPTARLAEVIRKWMDRYRDAVHDNGSHDKGIHQIEALTGIKPRRIQAILKEEGPTVLFDTADRILCGLDLVGLWHVAPEKGGLADWYEADEENPLPALPAATPQQSTIARKWNVKRWCKVHPLRAAFAEAYAIRRAKEAPVEVAA